jgi:serpin B
MRRGSMKKPVILTLLILSHLFVMIGRAEDKDLLSLVRGNSAFALGMYHKVRCSEGNIFFSPYSISTAFAMTYAGARGETQKQMAGVFHFPLETSQLHPSYSALQAHFLKLQKNSPFRLNIANALWIQKEYALLQIFLEMNQKYYQASLFNMNFRGDPEGSRLKINDWVEEKTEGKIHDLLPSGTIKTLTRLVLTNTIYFKAEWQNTFNAHNSKTQDFWISPDEKTKVQMMSQKDHFGYWENKTLQILEMPYIRQDLSMVVFLPRKKDGLPDLETKINPEYIDKWLSELKGQQVDVHFPKFTTTQKIDLKTILKALGMVDAFTENADFSGIEPKKELYITDALHKAYIDVDEVGTEAAAATAVSVGVTSILPPKVVPEFRADHPFFYIIKDNKTKSILFMGRLTRPAE